MVRRECISGGGMARVLLEPFASAGKDPDESLASFVRRRLGDEVLDYAINPFVSGIYAGTPETLSVRHAFPRLYQLEQSYRSEERRVGKESRSRCTTFLPKLKLFKTYIQSKLYLS